MTATQFEQWIVDYVRATGAARDVADTLLANERHIRVWARDDCGVLVAAADDMIGSGRVPKFANEHIVALRSAIQSVVVGSLNEQLPPDGDFAECETCGGSGLVTVPHRLSIYRGRVVLYRGRVVTAAVVCDAVGCVAGEVAETRERNRVLKIERDSGRRDKNHNRLACLGDYNRLHGFPTHVALAATERETAARYRDKNSVAEFKREYPNLARYIDQPPREEV